MTTLVEAGLGNALVALVLAVVALVVGLICRRPAVAHALWLLVLIKLVTPPLVSVSLPWPEEAAQVHEESRSSVAVEEVAFEIVEEPFVEPREAPPEPEAVAPMEESPTPEIAYSAPPWQVAFGLVWLGGSLTWFAVAARRLWRFARLLRHARTASAELTERVAALSRNLGLRKPPRVLLVQGRLSPMVWALGRVTLLVPAKLVSTMSAAAVETLLAHELAHIRRRDYWVRWLELVGLGLYWWNPVVWLARRELRQAEELCCDAWVVRCLPDARRVYATALVDALDFLSRPDEPVPALGCGLGRVDDLKWRLTMILRGQTSPRLGRTTTLGVFALALMMLPLVPGFGSAQSRAKTQTPAQPSLDQLEPETRVKVETMIAALLHQQAAKQAAEQQAKAERLARVERLDLQIAEGSQQADQIQALRAEIAAKMMALKQLEAKRGATKQGTTAAADPTHSFTIRIEVHGVNDPAALRLLGEKIQKAVEGNAKLLSIQMARPGADDPFRGSKTPPAAVPSPPVEFRGTKTIFGDRSRVEGTIRLVPDAGSGTKETTPTPDRRIDALEKKLDAVLRELEALRKAKTPTGRGTKPTDSRRTTPPESDPGERPAKPRGGAIAPLPAPAPRAAPAEATPPLPGIRP